MKRTSNEYFQVEEWKLPVAMLCKVDPQYMRPFWQLRAETTAAKAEARMSEHFMMIVVIIGFVVCVFEDEDRDSFLKGVYLVVSVIMLLI